MVRSRLRIDNRGQAVTEYILLLAAVVSFFLVIGSGLRRLNVAKALTRPLTEDFRYAYQYGHPKARGYEDEGGPKMHPRAVGGDPSNFRIFINPGVTR